MILTVLQDVAESGGSGTDDEIKRGQVCNPLSFHCNLVLTFLQVV